MEVLPQRLLPLYHCIAQFENVDPPSLSDPKLTLLIDIAGRLHRSNTLQFISSITIQVNLYLRRGYLIALAILKPNCLETFPTIIYLCQHLIFATSPLLSCLSPSIASNPQIYFARAPSIC